MPVRIPIADDHGVVRKGLRALLESQRGWRVCAEATNGRKAVKESGICKPDIAILDISMPELNGVEVTRQIRELCPQTAVLILSMHESDLLLHESLKAGAKGYLLKEDADDYLVSAVEALRQHKQYFSPKIARAMAEAPGPIKREAEQHVPLNRLTCKRERSHTVARGGKEQPGSGHDSQDQCEDWRGAQNQDHAEAGNTLDYRVGAIRDS
jgi:DNA-binding NarL/FixJ family response regulator